MRYVALIALLLSLPTLAFAADLPAPAAHDGTTETAETDIYPHPRVPEHPTWADNLVAVIALMFLAAFFVGPIVRATMPQEVEPPQAHDELGHGAHDDPHAHGHDTHGHGHAGHH
jgi:hypothetical protein